MWFGVKSNFLFFAISGHSCKEFRKLTGMVIVKKKKKDIVWEQIRASKSQ